MRWNVAASSVFCGLLKLALPDGLNLFRSFMTWAYRHNPALRWAYYLIVCRWIFSSKYQTSANDENIETLMVAAAARWINADDGQAREPAQAWQGAHLFIFDRLAGKGASSFGY